MVNPRTYITHPWARIPGFPDYAVNTDDGTVCRVTPHKYKSSVTLIAGDGSMPQHLWGVIKPFCLTENAMGQVMLVPRGGSRGLKRSVVNILKAVEEDQ